MGFLARIFARITTGYLGKNYYGNRGKNLGKNCHGNISKNLGKNYHGNLGKNLGKNYYGNLGRNLGKNYHGNLGKIYHRPTLTLTSHLRQNVGLREGQVGKMMIMIQKLL